MMDLLSSLFTPVHPACIFTYHMMSHAHKWYRTYHNLFKKVITEHILANIYLANIYLANIYLANIYLANIRLANICLANIYLANIYLANIYLANIYLAKQKEGEDSKTITAAIIICFQCFTLKYIFFVCCCCCCCCCCF